VADNFTWVASWFPAPGRLSGIPVLALHLLCQTQLKLRPHLPKVLNHYRDPNLLHFVMTAAVRHVPDSCVHLGDHVIPFVVPNRHGKQQSYPNSVSHHEPVTKSQEEKD
jgi:hypothetical protein